MQKRRVVVTGLGAISSLGLDSAAFWDAVVACRPGTGPIEAIQDERLSFKNSMEVRGFDAKSIFDTQEELSLDRAVQFAILAAREAVKNSGINWSEESGNRAAVVTGCAAGGKTTEDVEFEKLYAKGKKRSHPLTIPRVMGNAGASLISMEFGLRGPVFTLSTACSSANHAIGQAFWLVRDGVADTALAGGHEAFFCLSSLRAWDAMRVVTPDVCRPFSKNRDGMILGEGGGILVLETLEGAQARGARILAEIVGFGMTADAHHITMPSTDGPARAIRAALEDGRLNAQEVDYINAHGTGTPTNDPNEVKAIRSVFGSHAEKLAVSSTKSLHGHALSAAGALEAVATTMAIDQGVLPPTANYTDPDPECDVDVVPNESRKADIRAALSNSFAFGGLNAVLAFRRFDGNQTT